MAHIAKRKDRPGYIVRYIDPDGKERSRSKDDEDRRFLRKVDAQQLLHAIEMSKKSADYTDPRLGKVTFGEAASKALAMKVNQRPSTQARDEWAFRKLILPHFGSRRLNTIDSTDVKAWIASLTNDYSAPTIHKAYQLFAWVLQEAAEAGTISKSPCWKVKPKRDLPKMEHTEMRFLEEHEIHALAAAIDPRYRPLVLTAGYSGLRLGELSGLRLKHLRMLERVIRVEEAMTDVRGHQTFGPLKTKASRRSVSIPAFLVEVLAEHLTARAPLGPNDLIFVGEKGAPLRASNFRRRFWMPAVEASVGIPCRIHDLRHSHAALLIKAGVQPKVIQKRLGHSSIRTTFDTYGHVYDGLDQEAAQALDLSWKKLTDGTNTGRGRDTSALEGAKQP